MTNTSCVRGRERLAVAVAILQHRLGDLEMKHERMGGVSVRIGQEIACLTWLVTILSGKGPEVHSSLLDLARRTRYPNEVDDDDTRYRERS